MPRRLRRSTPSAAYLKPGALALLRNTRIRQIYLVRSLPAPPSPSRSTVPTPIDGSPRFSPRKINFPRCPQRKKIVGAKFVSFLNPPLSPGADSGDARIGGGGGGGGVGDAIAAH